MSEISRAESSSRMTGGKPKILFLDDEERILNALRAVFRFKYEVFTTTRGADALDILRAHTIAVVVSDQRMPEMAGIDFLRQAKVVSPDTLRILLTGFSDLRAIIDSVNEGEVFRFLNKPWGNQEIQAVLDDAVAVSLATRGSETADTAAHLTTEAAASSASASKAKIQILVRCRDSRLFEEIRAEAADEMTVLHAATQNDALSILQSKPVSVLVTTLDEDDMTKGEDSIEFLKQLKRELPELLTIGMAQQADHEKVVDLINQAKVHRYVVLPSRVSRILFFIRSAIDQHRRMVQNPALLRREEVEIKPLKKAHEIPAAVLSSIRSIRKIFSPRST